MTIGLHTLGDKSQWLLQPIEKGHYKTVTNTMPKRVELYDWCEAALVNIGRVLRKHSRFSSENPPLTKYVPSLRYSVPFFLFHRHFCDSKLILIDVKEKQKMRLEIIML